MVDIWKDMWIQCAQGYATHNPTLVFVHCYGGQKFDLTNLSSYIVAPPPRNLDSANFEFILFYPSPSLGCGLLGLAEVSFPRLNTN